MTNFKKAYILPALFLLTIGMVVGVEIESFLTRSDVAQLEKLQRAFFLISNQYVDDVDTDKMVENAINGMLTQLDPHSTYISAADIQEIQEEYQGSFGGIGIMFEMPDDTARVVSTITDGPSEHAGVMAGDRIIKINDSTAVGLTDRQIQKKLKGRAGTRVSITVKRPGIREPLAFEITRDRIPLYTVDSSYMIDDSTGYLRINRFAMTTYDEFLDHVGNLLAQGMDRLVLDLRSNPGGIMDPAIEIADEMLSAGKTIVYTRSRHSELEAMYESTAGGILEEQPVIVLVNPYSASASEIVSGALQDHDRAFIVGQRTFGKGLVQQQYRLDDGSVLQMTVSRYYTPSGRLIQTPYRNGNQEDYIDGKLATIEDATYHPDDYIDSIPDSLKFTTAHGRTVFGGGGILPDYIVAPDTTSLTAIVSGNGLDDLFARKWFDEREQSIRRQWNERADAFLSDFTVDETMWKQFLSYLESHDIKLSATGTEDTSDALAFTADQVAAARPVLETRLKFFIGRRLLGFEKALPIFNEVDPVLKAALQMWPNAVELAKLQRESTR